MDDLVARLKPSSYNLSLPSRERAAVLRRHALHCKYEKAVELYANTGMPLNAIARQCEVSVGGLGSYLRRYWRELVLRRHHIPAEGGALQDIKIIAVGQQNVNAHAKYKDAVRACEALDYIDLNVSQVARKFGLDGTALANFMRVHYLDILLRREEMRRRLGVNDNVLHGARPECIAQYAAAVELYRTTALTMAEVADRCHVSRSGLSQHLRFYHRAVIVEKRRMRREAALARKQRGDLSGNGRKYAPSARIEQKYAAALALYRDTALPLKDIVERTGVPMGGFRFYLHKWHRGLVLERSGIDGPLDEHADLRRVRVRMKTVAAKYAEAIESLRRQPRPVAQVAAEYGYHPEVFRDYLHKHEPELARRQGMALTPDGKRLSRRSQEKYAEAVRLYATTTENLKAIAARMGLTYNSVGGYIRRNFPEVVRRHRERLRGE